MDFPFTLLVLAGLWITGFAFQIIEVDVVAHVLLTGVHQRLVIPALQLADSQGFGDETPAPLTGEHLLVNRRNVPFGPRLGEKIVKQRPVLRRLAEFFLFTRVVMYVEE